MMMQIRSIFFAVLIAGASAFAAETTTDIKYQNDFQKAELDSFPDDLMRIEGEFSVKEENGNKFMELPGAPTDAFSFLFGSPARDSSAVSARIFGTSSGRKFPAFELGLFGVAGYKLRASPGKRELELYRGDTRKTGVPLKWQSGKWAHLKLQALKSGDKWKIEGRFWMEGAQEPAEPTLVFEDSAAPPSGRASVGGMPYSGTPIRFDDLAVLEPKAN